MKKLVLLLAFLSVSSFVLIAEEITIPGTGSGMDLLISVANEFMKANPGIKVTIPPSIGSGGGITVVSKDQALLGRIARPLKDSEKEPGLNYVEFVKIPIVFYVNSSAGIQGITQAQALDVFSGKIENWKAIGGADLPILLVKRNKGDSSLDVLSANLKGFTGENISTDAKTQFTDQKAIEYAVATKGAIAFGALADAANESALTVLSVDGIAPLDKNYPFLGPLGLIYKEANYKGTVKAFVDFVKSAKAKPVIVKAFGIPQF
jgi:phosphate transport system substrate-binding protein